MSDKIDRRIKYILVLDTETANGLDQPLVYDCGWAIVDKRGKVYKTRSYVNKDIFYRERGLMQTAYYAEKIPKYEAELKSKLRKLAGWEYIIRAFRNDIYKYRITTVCAHNARFDLNALNTSQRYITKSKYRYFFPRGIEIWDTMKMAEDVIAVQPTYRAWTKENGYVTSQGKPRITAEILYRYIKHDPDFIESHTGLEDVLIEKEILVYCFRQHKKMRKGVFEKKTP